MTKGDEMTSHDAHPDWISFDQVIGRRLACIQQVSEINDENGIDWATSYFVLDSGDCFYLPSSRTDRFYRETADGGAEQLDELEDIYGRRITAILFGKDDRSGEESMYLQLDNGVLIASVLSGPHGTASPGVYIHSLDEALGSLTVLAGEMHRRATPGATRESQSFRGDGVENAP